ncbi:GNAT family N-acetyltransferase [Ensifer sp. IC4062]|nr:GNAT family N-acetyltransferase [Ensifer sp. IC4062]MCA1442978.1 GNAT family N-acetyltransferase [Ensifer sp. IC4062]
MNIIAAGPADDPILVAHYLAIWDSYGTPQEDYVDDAAQRVIAFIEETRAAGHHGGFLAVIDGEIAGSAMCCLLRSPYPEVIRPERRLMGYIWSVYTETSQRGKGVGKALTQRSIGHLKEIGCNSIVLHASDAGAPMYEKLGFKRAGEMRLAV